MAYDPDNLQFIEEHRMPMRETIDDMIADAKASGYEVNFPPPLVAILQALAAGVDHPVVWIDPARVAGEAVATFEANNAVNAAAGEQAQPTASEAAGGEAANATASEAGQADSPAPAEQPQG